MSRKSRPSVSIASTTTVEQVVAMIDAGYWNWDEEGYRAALLALDEAALALIGEMWRLLAIEGEPEDATGLVGPLYELFNAAIVYSRHGADPEIAARFRDLVNESLHVEQFARMEATVELAWSEGGVA